MTGVSATARTLCGDPGQSDRYPRRISGHRAVEPGLCSSLSRMLTEQTTISSGIARMARDIGSAGQSASNSSRT